MNKIILCTGAKGFIGTHLASKLGEFVSIDLQDGNNLLTCDLPDGIDLIYHLAAQASVESSWHDPLHDLDNIRITARLVKEYPNARIVYAQSCASISVGSPYGFSKKASGDYLKAFHRDWVSCVFPNVYGPNSHSVVDIFKGKDRVTIFGDGTHVRDYVHVDDIVAGLLQARNWPKGEYFMGSGIGTTVLELAAGKEIVWATARKEDRQVIVPNTTPDWQSSFDVMAYIRS